MAKSRYGKLVVAQSGGPTPVINASLAGIIQEAHSRAFVGGIFGFVHGIEGALKEDMIDLGKESQETITQLVNTPASILGSCRHKLTDPDYERILKVFQVHDLRYFVYIGGNDSMDTCHRVSKLARSIGYELQVIGVPKTIDNDLVHTDHTPGYGSAAKFVAIATRDAGLDLESMETFDDVTILETMGRHTGWLAAASILGKEREEDAPHLVYFPEQPFDENRFLEDIEQVYRRFGRVFVVVGEGLRYETDEFVGQHRMQDGGKDAFGHTLVSLTTGVAAYLTDVVRKNLQLQVRYLRPALIGRVFSACVSTIDREEAQEVGRKAVEALCQDKNGLMVTLERQSNDPYEYETGLVPLADVANKEKPLPRKFINDLGNMATQAFLEYGLPLIDGPLPKIARLQRNKVSKRVHMDDSTY